MDARFPALRGPAGALAEHREPTGNLTAGSLGTVLLGATNRTRREAAVTSIGDGIVLLAGVRPDAEAQLSGIHKSVDPARRIV